MLILIYLIYLAIFCSETNNVNAACPNGWIGFEHSCYFFAHQRFPWPQASVTCATLKSKLVEIETAEEDAFLYGELKQMNGSFSGGRFWIGGTDMTEEGTWIWTSTQQTFTYTNWFPGEPNSLHGEDCADLLMIAPGWNDLHCTTHSHFICEKP